MTFPKIRQKLEKIRSISGYGNKLELLEPPSSLMCPSSSLSQPPPSPSPSCTPRSTCPSPTSQPYPPAACIGPTPSASRCSACCSAWSPRSSCYVLSVLCLIARRWFHQRIPPQRSGAKHTPSPEALRLRLHRCAPLHRSRLSPRPRPRRALRRVSRGGLQRRRVVVRARLSLEVCSAVAGCQERLPVV